MEKWKTIPGYEGLYEASNTGQIRTCYGKTTSSKRFQTRVWKQRILKPIWVKRPKSQKMQANVKLWKDGTVKTFLVARLIAMTWCNGYEDGFTVNHIDGDTTNNHAENLEWITLKDNINKGFKGGLYSHCKSVQLIANDGRVYSFYSMEEASRFLGKSHGFLHSTIKHNRFEACSYKIAQFGG